MISATERLDDISVIENDLLSVALFKNGCQTLIKQLASGAQYQKHPKGKILFVNQDPAERFYIIKSGWVKLFRETVDGTQAVVDILDRGHIFGEHALFNNGLYSYSAEVAEAAEIISLPMQYLQKELQQNNALSLNMLETMAQQHLKLDKEVEHRSLQTAPQRIGCFILRLARDTQDDKITIQLPYDKTLVASRLGMQPETFSRALSKLKNQTGIRVKGSIIEVENLSPLIEYTCNACSSNYPCKDLPPEE